MSPRGALPTPVFWPLKPPKTADFGVTLRQSLQTATIAIVHWVLRRGPECNAAKLHFLLQSLPQGRGEMHGRAGLGMNVQTCSRWNMTRLTPNAAAERSGQSRATITRAIAAGELAATKHRSRWSIDLDDLDRWTAQRPVSAGRGADGRFRKGEIPAAPQMPLRVAESAVEGQNDPDRIRARLEALEALCDALRDEIEYLRGQVRELSAGGASLPPASAPGTKRRLWPFSGKS